MGGGVRPAGTDTSQDELLIVTLVSPVGVGSVSQAWPLSVAQLSLLLVVLGVPLVSEGCHLILGSNARICAAFCC